MGSLSLGASAWGKFSGKLEKLRLKGDVNSAKSLILLYFELARWEILHLRAREFSPGSG